MKKKLYLQPSIIVTGIRPLQLICASRGWSQDGESPTTVEKEDEVDDDDKLPASGDLWEEDDGYGGFLDLD